jgi:hypothetical protein
VPFRFRPGFLRHLARGIASTKRAENLAGESYQIIFRVLM